MIRIVKLISGEQFIADVEKVDNNTLKVNHPYVYMQSERGIVGRPLIMFADDSQTFEFNMQHILCMAIAEPEVEQGYSNQIGKIVIPDNKLILGG